eukprot:324323-Pleurochrysis_carterae.AAC.1
MPAASCSSMLRFASFTSVADRFRELSLTVGLESYHSANKDLVKALLHVRAARRRFVVAGR